MSTVTKEELHKKVLDRKDELVSLCQDLIRIKNQSPLDPQEPAVDFVRAISRATASSRSAWLPTRARTTR